MECILSSYSFGMKAHSFFKFHYIHETFIDPLVECSPLLKTPLRDKIFLIHKVFPHLIILVLFYSLLDVGRWWTLFNSLLCLNNLQHLVCRKFSIITEEHKLFWKYLEKYKSFENKIIYSEGICHTQFFKIVKKPCWYYVDSHNVKAEKAYIFCGLILSFFKWRMWRPMKSRALFMICFYWCETSNSICDWVKEFGSVISSKSIVMIKFSSCHKKADIWIFLWEYLNFPKWRKCNGWIFRFRKS